MTWLYSGNPATSNKDAVRFLIGDTNTTDQKLQDEEINYLLTVYGTPAMAAAESLEQLARRMAQSAEFAIGRYRESLVEGATLLNQKARELRQQAGAIGAKGIYAGGISRTDKDAQELDTDRVQPAFARDQHAHPEDRGRVAEDEKRGGV